MQRPLGTISKLRQLRQALRALEIDERRGILKAYDERFLFIPVSLIHSIEDRLADHFGPVTATSFQYELGKEGGEHYIRIAEKAGFNIKNKSDLSKIAERLGTLGGWGKLDVREFDFDKNLARIRWTNGISVRNRKGKTPVCHFGRGILTGATEAVLKTKCESLEVRCQGKGDDYCEAIIGDPAEIVRLANDSRT